MRVAILTFARVPNFGACLQAYALQHSVLKFADDCELLNYEGLIEKKQAKRSFVSRINSVLVDILFNISGSRRRTEEFKRRFFNLSKLYDPATIAQSNKAYDIFITGSDQVWNLALTKGDMAYFLDFVTENSKRNSYAASIGTNIIPKEYEDVVKNELKKFGGMITVRENQAQIYLQEHFNISSKVVLDPTLLLTMEEWEAVLPQKTKKREKYMLIYQMGRSKTLIKAAQDEARKHNMKLISIRPPLDNLIWGKNYFGVGPSEFVELFIGAEKVFTNSFHGTVFALNFNKDLHVELLKKGGVNSRLQSILSNVGLQHRFLGTKEYDASREIDFSKVNYYLQIAREESLACIKNICEIKG